MNTRQLTTNDSESRDGQAMLFDRLATLSQTSAGHFTLENPTMKLDNRLLEGIVLADPLCQVADALSCICTAMTKAEHHA